jgi:hypothetical protein
VEQRQQMWMARLRFPATQQSPPALVKLPYTALADQKHGRRQCQHAWVGPQHAQKAKFLNLKFVDRGKIKLTITFSGNILELNLKKREFKFCCSPSKDTSFRF